MSFQRLDPQDFLVSIDSITSTCWSNNNPTLVSFYTSSTQEASSGGNFYLNVYQTSSTNPNAEVQFSIAYGDGLGSGSTFYDTLVPNISSTRTTYGQYRTLILEDENSDFVFGGQTINNFYAINVNRSRYKENLFPGSLNLKLFSGSKYIQLTDNSNDVTTISFLNSNRVYQIVSGSNGSATNNPISQAGITPSGSYGLFLPDTGLILLNPAALDLPFASGGINLQTSRSYNSPGNNNSRLFSRLISGSNGTGSFSLNSQESISSDFVFIRARNAEFNYTENPSAISGSTGELIYSDFIYNPQTYITTVGLYNDSNELLAVAKLSRPLKKDFTKEALVRVKLDF
jgi:hypothetical protein